MEVIKYVINIFFPGDGAGWLWNYLLLLLMIVCWRSSGKTDKYFNIK